MPPQLGGARVEVSESSFEVVEVESQLDLLGLAEAGHYEYRSA
jgi:hypothetical protein